MSMCFLRICIIFSCPYSACVLYLWYIGGFIVGIGNKLDELLKKQNMTVTELARRVGVAPTTIYSIIQRNNKKVDIDVLLNIADILGVDVDYFRDSEKPVTIAAHFDGNEFTEEELDEIRNFAEYVKSKRK